MKKKCLLLLVLFSILSCSENDSDRTTVTNVDEFIIGTFHGECIGERCMNFYQVKNQQLFQDNITTYRGAFSFSDNALSQEKYLLIVNLLNQMPQFLIERPDTTYGCPDCADQGGIQIQIQKDGVIKNWQIDLNSFEQPDAIKGYVQKVVEVLNQL